jgi:polysaccharide biosynthesis transport protein
VHSSGKDVWETTVSKNFELMRRAGVSVGSRETLPSPEVVAPTIERHHEETTIATPEWMMAFSILRKHWRLSAMFAALVMVTVVVVTLAMKPVYEPSARIEVDPPGETFSLEGANSGTSDAEYLETQSQNLKNDKLAIAVIRKLHLDQNPELVPEEKTRARNRFKGNPAGDVIQLTPAENAALGAFKARLAVQRDTASRLITVSFASHDPRLAALITNTIVDTFIEQTYEEQHDAIMKSTEWLARQLDDIRTRMETSNKVLTDFQKSVGIADLDDNRSTFTQQMTELNNQLTQAQADRIQLEALLASVRHGGSDSLPDVRNNPVVQQLSTHLAEQRAELSQAMVIYGKNHPTVKKLQSQVDELQAQLDAQKTAILQSIRTSYAAAHAKEQLMDSEIKGTSNELSKMARYNALKKEAQANSDLYNTLYARVKEAGIAAASKSSNLRVVDEARVLTFPSRPNRILNFGVGLLAALLGGVGLAFLREQVDQRIFTPEDVRHWIGGANICIVPQFFSAQSRQLPGTNGHAPGREKLAPGVRFLLDRPHSLEAEALRSLYTSIMLSRRGTPPQAVLVVSSFPGEGKTTVAVNLALAMAQHGSTCVVDADLRRGRVAAAFGLTGKVGLADVLSGAATMESALVEVPSLSNLTVLPAHAGDINAGTLVCSEAMQNVINDLRERFRFIVVDSAPLLPFADGRALSASVDGLIFVGRSGITTRDVVRRSLELLEEVHAAPVLEFVLNAADLNSPQYRYYQYGYDYYDRAAAK